MSCEHDSVKDMSVEIVNEDPMLFGTCTDCGKEVVAVDLDLEMLQDEAVLYGLEWGAW